MPIASVLVCAGCGYRVPPQAVYSFSCPRRRPGDDVDHVLRRALDPSGVGSIADIEAIFDDDEPNPFLRYRRLSHVYHAARVHGLTGHECVELVERLDREIARVEGKGFRETPFESKTALAEAVGAGQLWVKNESVNVAGTHKARHLMAVLIWLRTLERLHPEGGTDSEILAASSCGNAAVAAAVLASAAGRPLQVLVPEGVPQAASERIQRLGAVLVTCARREGEAGDPCYLQLQRSLSAGAVPFTCQGSENGLIADGGLTLPWEIVSALRREGGQLDRLFVQVGGGALAAACAQGLREAVDLGVLARLPKLHAVQTAGAYPLWRAWRRVVAHLIGGLPPGDEPAAPEVAAGWAEAAAAASPRQIRQALRHAASHRSEFMWPWEEEPHSAASSILDDETYDWLRVVEAMLESGGYPVVVSEERLFEAERLAASASGIAADASGAAGLAGCLELRQSGRDLSGESVAVLFTAARSGSPGEQGSTAAA